jgi:single-strand DNA-binding protein
MSKHGLDLTIAGTVGSDVRIYHKDDGGTPFAMFRMVHTPRVRDAAGTWRDGASEWFTVKLFRQAALNAEASLHSGDAVLVHGRLSTEDWTDAGVTRTGLVLTASSLGHDLTRGVATFRRVSAARPSEGEQEAAPTDVTGLQELPETDSRAFAPTGALEQDDAFDDEAAEEDAPGELVGAGVGRSALAGAF